MNDIDDEIIGRLVNGNLSADDELVLEQWKAESEDNAHVLAQMESIVVDLQRLHFMQAVDSAAALRHVKRKLNAPSLFKRMLATWQQVAAVLIIPLIFLVAYQYFDASRANDKLAVVWHEVSTPYGLSSKVALPDGTEVELNGRSTLRYPSAFSGKTRNVELQGEAFFHVATNPKQPFVVKCNQVLVEAVGTEFNVLELEQGKVATSLVEGKVNLYKQDGNQKIITLQPGQTLQYDCTAAKIFKLENRDIDKYVAWREGKIIFRGDLFSDVLAQLSRRYNVQFEVSPEINNEHSFTGVFVDKDLKQVLRYIELTTPVVFNTISDKSDEINVIRVTRK
ncbi:MAG: FecR family protein [Mangrovibacterium sp.]